MKTKELVQKMETVYPALAAHGTVPMFTHFWFTGHELLTYNDFMGMQVPCETDFAGCVPEEFLRLLRVSDPEREIKLEFGEKDFDVHNGRNIGTFPFIPIDDTAELFTMPQPVKGDTAKAELPVLRAAFEALLLSVSTQTHDAEQMGITFMPSDEVLTLFSCNDNSFTRAKLPAGPSKFNKRVTVMSEFCKIFLNLTKGIGEDTRDEQDKEGAKKRKRAEVHFQLNPEYSLAQVGDTLLFAKTIAVERPQKYDQIFDQYYTAEVYKRMIPIPDELLTLVNRALVVTESDVDQEKSTLAVEEGKLSYVSKTKRGVVDDEMKFDHDDIGPVKIQSKLLKTGLEHYKNICITKRAVILSDDLSVYLIATTG
jgi:hypothetical protein